MVIGLSIFDDDQVRWQINLLCQIIVFEVGIHRQQGSLCNTARGVCLREIEFQPYFGLLHLVPHDGNRRA